MQDSGLAFLGYSIFSDYFSRKVTQQESNNDTQRDQDDLGYGYFPKIESQSHDFHVLKQEDQKQHKHDEPNDDLWIFHNGPLM